MNVKKKKIPSKITKVRVRTLKQILYCYINAHKQNKSFTRLKKLFVT